MRLYADAYEVTLYPNGDLAIGCKRMSLDEWERQATDIATDEHAEQAVRYDSLTRQLVTLCRAFQVVQP